MPAIAYVNQGTWVADCPAGCGNAMRLKPKQTRFVCGVFVAGALEAGCGAMADLGWPRDAVWIWDALMQRPAARTRNWAPAGHWQAIATGFPAGQSVADLVAETRAHLSAA